MSHTFDARFLLYNETSWIDRFNIPDNMHLDKTVREYLNTSSLDYFLPKEMLNIDGSHHNSSWLWDRSVGHHLQQDTMSIGVTTESTPVFNNISLIKIIVLSIMFVISFIGNTATLIQMYRMRRRKSTINTLIMHLACADLIVTFFCNVTEVAWQSTIQWLAGNFMCKVVKFMQVFGLYLSTYITVIISLDRCMAILDPMSRNKAPKRVRSMIIVAWILSALFSSPQLYIFRVAQGPFEEVFYQCVTFGAYAAEWQEPMYSCLSTLLLFIIPLVTMMTAYMLIFCTISKKSRDLQREAESEKDSASQEMLSRGPVRGQLFRKAKVKSLRMTALIVAAFIVFWSPYYVLFFLFTFYQNEIIKMDSRALIWIFFFGMANSMVNPMIYGAFHVCARRRRNDSTQVRWHVPLDHQCPAKTASTAQPRGLGNTKPNPHSTTTQSTGVQLVGANHRHLDPNHGPTCPIKFRTYQNSDRVPMNQSDTSGSSSGHSHKPIDKNCNLRYTWKQLNGGLKTATPGGGGNSSCSSTSSSGSNCSDRVCGMEGKVYFLKAGQNGAVNDNKQVKLHFSV